MLHLDQMMRRPRNRRAFTLIEIMIVLAIIALLAALAVPSWMRARKRAAGVKAANALRVFGDAFALYAVENGQYPKDSHMVLPPGAGMELYLEEATWLAPTPIGGRFNWEGPDYYGFAAVAIGGSPYPDEDLLLIDEAVDDGNLSSGQYQKLQANDRFAYIIEGTP